VIFYTPLPDQILIERVLHGARDIPVIYGEEI
jgi:plasmid stabilization system protein ParE